MGWGALAGAAGSALGGLMGGMSAQDAAALQVAAIKEHNKFQKWLYEDQKEMQKPFREAGIAGNNALLEYLGLGGDEAAEHYGTLKDAQFGAAEFEQYKDPGYDFRLSEGMKALENSAAARGNLLSGNTLKGAQEYAQDLASTEYQNAFNRYQTMRMNTLNPLQSLSGAGQTATNSLSNAASQYGHNMSNAYMSMGNAQAAGQQGMTNSLINGVMGGLNFYNQSSMLSGLLGG